MWTGLSGSEYGTGIGCYEHGNETSDSMKDGEFTD
jgi:hypothetical protein